MTHPLDPRALEAAARALSKLHIEASLEKGSGWRVAAHRGARAAVTAYLDALQETHTLVPREPTETMMLASRRVEPSTHWRDNIRRAWSAMIDAAPPAAQEKK